MNWDQLKTILWLRWRLTRNQMSRSKGIGAVIAAIVAGGALVLGGASFVGALLAGGLARADRGLPVLLDDRPDPGNPALGEH